MKQMIKNFILNSEEYFLKNKKILSIIGKSFFCVGVFYSVFALFEPNDFNYEQRYNIGLCGVVIGFFIMALLSKNVVRVIILTTSFLFIILVPLLLFTSLEKEIPQHIDYILSSMLIVAIVFAFKYTEKFIVDFKEWMANFSEQKYKKISSIVIGISTLVAAIISLLKPVLNIITDFFSSLK